METKEDIKSYLKLFGGLMMISPLAVSYWRLSGFSVNESFSISGFTYFVMMSLAIPMYNYLQHGKFRLWINHEKEKSFDEWYHEFSFKCLHVCFYNHSSDYIPEAYKFLYTEGFSVDKAVKYYAKINKLIY